jgi:hypothetical protein
MAWHRCFGCNKDVPLEDSVWLDANGDLVTWAPGTIPETPAPFHKECGERHTERCRALGRRSAPERPSPAPEKGYVIPKPVLEKGKKKKVDKRQMGLF